MECASARDLTNRVYLNEGDVARNLGVDFVQQVGELATTSASENVGLAVMRDDRVTVEFWSQVIDSSPTAVVILPEIVEGGVVSQRFGVVTDTTVDNH